MSKAGMVISLWTLYSVFFHTTFETDEHTVALRHFDEGAGSVAKDATGRFVLSLEGEQLWGEKGKYGKCLDLNGKDECAYIAFSNQIGAGKELNLGPLPLTISSKIRRRISRIHRTWP